MLLGDGSELALVELGIPLLGKGGACVGGRKRRPNGMMFDGKQRDLLAGLKIDQAVQAEFEGGNSILLVR